MRITALSNLHLVCPISIEADGPYTFLSPIMLRPGDVLYEAHQGRTDYYQLANLPGLIVCRPLQHRIMIEQAPACSCGRKCRKGQPRYANYLLNVQLQPLPEELREHANEARLALLDLPF